MEEYTEQDWEDLRQKVVDDCVSEAIKNNVTAQELINECKVGEEDGR